MADFRTIADEISSDIADGRLRSGDKLEPQREFAHRRNIAPSTAGRVYRELVKRGLVAGEVGRGTFVRSRREPGAPFLSQPAAAAVDLTLIHSAIPEQTSLVAAHVQSVARSSSALEECLRPALVWGTPDARLAASDLISTSGWHCPPDRLLFAGSGKQALGGVLKGLLAPGDCLGLESLTYPVVRSLADGLGVTMVPIELDAFGLVPAAVKAAFARRPFKALYVQPTLHNPLGVTIPQERRQELARLASALDFMIIEDHVNAFLVDGPPPIAAFSPDHSILVDSLSKRVAAGTSVGVIAAPPPAAERVALALRAGCWLPGGLALEVSKRCIREGTVERLVMLKRSDAARRQEIARKALAEFGPDGSSPAYHRWLPLPPPWRSSEFVVAAARKGIAVSPASAFSVSEGHAPNAVRLALASPEADVLAWALESLAALARQGPEAWSAD